MDGTPMGPPFFVNRSGQFNLHKSTAIDPPSPSAPSVRRSPTLAPMTAALAPQRRFPRSPVGRTDGRKEGETGAPSEEDGQRGGEA